MNCFKFDEQSHIAVVLLRSSKVRKKFRQTTQKNHSERLTKFSGEADLRGKKFFPSFKVEKTILQRNNRLFELKSRK